MKKILSYTAFGLAALLGACTGDEQAVAAPEPARISASIGRTSRAVGNRWDSGDRIGVTAVNGSRANLPYTTAQGNGDFVYSGEATPIYFMDFATVSFSAYYPFAGTEGSLPAPVEVNTKDQTLSKDFDYLYATASGSAANPDVTFEFRHIMTQVVFNLKSGQYTAEDLRKGTFTLTNVCVAGSFDPSDGSVAIKQPVAIGGSIPIEGTAPIVVEAAKTDVVGTLSAGSDDVLLSVGMILLPQLLSEASFKATIGDVTYQVSIPERDLAAEKTYVYNVMLTADAISMAPCTIAPRTDGGSFGVQTEL